MGISRSRILHDRPRRKKIIPINLESKYNCKYNFNYEANHIREMQRYYVIEFE